MSSTIAKSKYNSIKTRSFKTYLDLFLISCYQDDKTLQNASYDNFILFNYDDSRIPKSLTAYQLTIDTAKYSNAPVLMLDEAIEKWHKNNSLKEYKQFFKHNRIISKEEFVKFYGKDEEDRKCEYCEISENEVDKLIDKGLLFTKRLSTRGRSMEIDRMEADKGYTEGNIVKCCYWCNNAKTDEFTSDEFKSIGKLIGQTLRNRL